MKIKQPRWVYTDDYSGYIETAIWRHVKSWVRKHYLWPKHKISPHPAPLEGQLFPGLQPPDLVSWDWPAAPEVSR